MIMFNEKDYFYQYVILPMVNGQLSLLNNLAGFPLYVFIIIFIISCCEENIFNYEIIC